MKKVLFVSSGGICRAPIAEAVLNEICKNEGINVDVDSAATSDWHIGDFPHEDTVELLAKKKIALKEKESRKVEAEDLEDFDYILAMDAETLGELHRLAGMREAGMMARLLDFAEDLKEDDIPDPYITGEFDKAFDLITVGCEHFIRKMKKNRLLR
ncbi:low molecular weight protein-tyrosine-phosphatase [Bacillus sp. Marseille-Q3570]|uniref:low molecular weight protein-tyrosine-phosphatase n=1 Tax=Bacillus sp. Marseille-Q3570 TaxID=2963522 RepID=UPI0021B738CB|nr:low molecular weight protein-tyrosine-phosphatase [Bacillus sp. Marseille-Q3570]